jgi:hypothetical protein
MLLLAKLGADIARPLAASLAGPAALRRLSTPLWAAAADGLSLAIEALQQIGVRVAAKLDGCGEVRRRPGAGDPQRVSFDAQGCEYPVHIAAERGHRLAIGTLVLLGAAIDQLDEASAHAARCHGHIGSLTGAARRHAAHARRSRGQRRGRARAAAPGRPR